jgi:uncharacterized membrane protein YkoI
MFSKIKIQSVILFVAFSLISSMAFAKGHKREAMSYFFLKKTDFNLEQSIQQLEQENKGKVVSAAVKMEDETPFFELKRIENGTVMEVLLDPKTKKVVETSKDGIFSRYSDEEDRTAALNAKVSLLSAMEIAKKQYDGLIVSAQFSNKGELNCYRIQMVTNQGGYTILVDTDSGDTFKDARHDKKGHDKSKKH